MIGKQAGSLYIIAEPVWIFISSLLASTRKEGLPSARQKNVTTTDRKPVRQYVSHYRMRLSLLKVGEPTQSLHSTRIQVGCCLDDIAMPRIARSFV